MERTSGGPVIRPLTDVIAAAIDEGRPIWFDTPAIIAYLQDHNPFSSIVAPLLEHVAISTGISAISLTEVLVGPALADDRIMMDRIYAGLTSLPRFVIRSFDDEVAIETAMVRSMTGLKLPDAAIVATARVADAVAILGNDRRWKSGPLGVRYIHLADLADDLHL